jgi:4,5-DOPA dioxygenase extradiol
MQQYVAIKGGRTQHETIKLEGMATNPRLPALFVGCGGPDFGDDQRWLGELRVWAARLPRPRAILMLSAHWESRPLAIGATDAPPLIYDFGGFPERYYRTRYPVPGAPWLAERVRELLRAAGTPFVDAPGRGLDHGAYLPLLGLYPDADVPVLQLSLPTEEPRALLALGRALAPLRDEGVLIVGAGLLVHSMPAIFEAAARLSPRRGLDLERLRAVTDAPPWVREFDAWVADVLARRDWDALVDYRRRAPFVERALPTHEHFLPLIVVAGAGADDPVSFPITGYVYGAATRRSVQLGAVDGEPAA